MDSYSNPPRVKALTFFQSVFLRPGMYTPNGTLNEVVALLAGSEMGLRTGDARERELNELMLWLHEVANVPHHEPWLPATLATALGVAFDSEDAFFAAVVEFLNKRAPP